MRLLARLYTRLLGHWYYSSACLHGRHDHCHARRVGERIRPPGRCEFCDAPCVCGCHRAVPLRRIEPTSVL